MDVPRGKRVNSQDRLKNIGLNGAGLGMLGGTRMAKPVSRTSKTNSKSTAGIVTAGRNRLTLQWFSDDIAGDSGHITAWPGGIGDAFDYEGSSIQLNDPDNGRIYLFNEGVYSVTCTLQASGISSADPAAGITAGFAVFDAPDGENYGVALPGGTPEGGDASGCFSVSHTFYSQGRGIGGGGVRFGTDTLGDLSAVGRTWVTAVVQRIT